MFVAILDTNVLWPSTQRDFLLSLHIAGAYRAVWSEAILEELQFHEAEKLAKRGFTDHNAEERAERLIAQMREHFADSVVHGWEGLDGTFALPDPDDEHVVAAAVVGGAEVIVTKNLRHFPSGRLPDGIEAIDPSDFARNTVELSPRGAIAAVDELVSRSGRFGPSLTREGVFQILEDRYGMEAAVSIMREHLGA